MNTYRTFALPQLFSVCNWNLPRWWNFNKTITHNIILAHKNTIFTKVQWKHNAMPKVNTKQHFKLWNSHQTNRIPCWVAGIFPFCFSWILNFNVENACIVVLLRWWSDKNCSQGCAWASKRIDRIHIQNKIWAIFLKKIEWKLKWTFSAPLWA